MGGNTLRMKYFICNIDNINLGIPAEWTERIISSNRTQTAVYEESSYEETSIGAYISIPALLQLKETSAPHGLVFKSADPVKTVLLTPKIEIELEIPQESIHRLPLALTEKLAFFSGVYFTGESVILILDPEKLLESITS